MIKIQGFYANGISSGIKKSGKKDLGMIFSRKPANCTAVFTRNIVKGAPVLIGMERIRKGLCQAILVNSGVANTYTGQEGIKNALETTRHLSMELNIEENLIIPSSTGIIGGKLPVDKIKKGIPRLVAGLSEDKFGDFSESIMTTDRFPKLAQRKLRIGNCSVTIAAIAKGAGMIAPDMATMLCFIMTDAEIRKNAMKKALTSSVDQSYNRTIIDGDTSTNDSVFLMSNGMANNRIISPKSRDHEKFTEALTDLNTELAEMMVRDGEGSTKLVKIIVRGAKTDSEARKVARTVGTSLLVKTAFYGEDPNWGRLIAAAGRAGVKFDPEKLEMYFDRIKVIKDGKQFRNESVYCEIFKKDNFTITLDLKNGDSDSFVLTSDLTLDYVKLNSHYRT